ncbi:BaiN/RdsA family NAD(P)/FAD-dependent oxidoreductase [Defluviitalea phaphyphila]|uniref:NAD(P)/FAD-dependent oxidoreductase n=1 Tax=Defluviitalea phaphyphila TaxID=1473580 RepID=UPI000730A80A|nr:NAD(P)/FAD-dependent oxidoreductase [Defluviitalea phaphyphila]
MNLYDVIIIGAGPSGLFAGISCKKSNEKVLILEKNEQAGKKLLISGGGQCNITHNGDIREFFSHYGNNGKFIRYALSKFTNEDILKFLKEEGLNYIVNEEGKIYPHTKKAYDVLNVLLNKCKKLGINIYYHNKVISIEHKNELFKIITNNNIYFSKYLIIATGGKSYPKTGSEGDGFIFAKKLGHKVENVSPALTPLYIKNYPFSNLAGISLKDTNISIWRNEKKILSFHGDILFTHKGLSGPAILNNSRYIRKEDIIKINFIKNFNEEDFRNFFIEKLEINKRKTLKSLFRTFNIPKRLSEKLWEMSNSSNELQCANVGKKLRNKIIELLTAFPMEVERLGDFNIAMVTKGGVSLKEINPKTMESKKIKGLYFIGEVLDIDGDTGGYNIQAAFSSAAVAGQHIKTQI